jgi:hypothetical protein
MRTRSTGLLVLLALASLVCGSPRVDAASPPAQGPLTPGAVAVADADGYVFATSGDEVAVFRMSGGSRIATFADQQGVSDLLVQGHTLYVLAEGAHELNVFNARDLVPAGSWDLSELADIHSMAATTGALWFAYADDETHDALARLDTSTGALTTALATVPPVADLAATASPARLFTLDRTSGPSSIHAFDVSSAEPIPLASTPAGDDCTDGTQLAARAGSVWAACGAPNAFAGWTTANLAASPRAYPAAATPNAVAVSGDGSLLVGGTRSPDGDDVWLYDTGTSEAVTTFPVDLGDVADGMVTVDYYGDRIYVVTTQGYLRTIDLRPRVSEPPPGMHTNQSGDVPVTGDMFSTVSAVWINGTPTSFTVLNDHQLTFFDPGLPNGLYPLTIINHWAANAYSSYAYLWVTPVPPSAPGRPQISDSWPHSIWLEWTPPENNGGGGIQSYRVRAYRSYGDRKGLAWEQSFPGDVPGVTLEDLPSEYRYSFKVAAGNAAGAGDWSALSAVVTVPSPAMGPFDSIADFVDRQFRDVVRRGPSEHESNDWLHRVRWNLAQPVELVRELRASDDNRSNVDPVERLYLAAFGRPADAPGLRYWSTRSRQGVTRAAISATFAGTGEFARTYGSADDHDYIERVYENVLGRPGDPDGVAYWTDLLESGRTTRGQVMVSFSESHEFVRSQSAEVEAAAIPAMLLGRGPTPDEFQRWVSAIDEAASAEDLIAEVLASRAYGDRIAAIG